MISTDSDKGEAGYGVLLPGETPTRTKARGARDAGRGSSGANTKKGSKASASKKGSAAGGTSANRPKQNVPAAPANPAFAFSNNQTKDKFRPGWAV